MAKTKMRLYIKYTEILHISFFSTFETGSHQARMQIGEYHVFYW